MGQGKGRKGWNWWGGLGLLGGWDMVAPSTTGSKGLLQGCLILHWQNSPWRLKESHCRGFPLGEGDQYPLPPSRPWRLLWILWDAATNQVPWEFPATQSHHPEGETPNLNRVLFLEKKPTHKTHLPPLIIAVNIPHNSLNKDLVFIHSCE